MHGSKWSINSTRIVQFWSALMGSPRVYGHSPSATAAMKPRQPCASCALASHLRRRTRAQRSAMAAAAVTRGARRARMRMHMHTHGAPAGVCGRSCVRARVRCGIHTRHPHGHTRTLWRLGRTAVQPRAQCMSCVYERYDARSSPRCPCRAYVQYVWSALLLYVYVCGMVCVWCAHCRVRTRYRTRVQLYCTRVVVNDKELRVVSYSTRPYPYSRFLLYTPLLAPLVCCNS